METEQELWQFTAAPFNPNTKAISEYPGSGFSFIYFLTEKYPVHSTVMNCYRNREMGCAYYHVSPTSRLKTLNTQINIDQEANLFNINGQVVYKNKGNSTLKSVSSPERIRLPWV